VKSFVRNIIITQKKSYNLVLGEGATWYVMLILGVLFQIEY